MTTTAPTTAGSYRSSTSTTPEPFHRCPCCQTAYATEADWLACPLPRGGEYQHGGDCLLRLRLCSGCGTSMAREVADPYQAAIDAASEGGGFAAGYAVVSSYTTDLLDALRSAVGALPRCSFCDELATVTTTHGTAPCCDACADDLETRDLPQAAAVRLVGRTA